MLRYTILCYLLAMSASTASGQDKTAILRDTLSAGTFDAAILEMRMPADAAAIMMKFSQAVAAKPGWIQSYVATQRQLKPGEPLPYHENMGVTEMEYARLIAAKAETKLMPVENCQLIVKSNDDGVLSLSGTGRASVLNGLTIDPEMMAIHYRDLSSNACRIATPKKTALVSISGLDWNTERVTPPANVAALSLTLGRYTETNQGFLEFRATKASGRVPSIMHHLYLQWQP